MGKRPKLTDELEALRPLKKPAMAQSAEELDQTEADLDILRFLVDLFSQCTAENPKSRPTADSLYKLLFDRSTALTSSRSEKC